MKKSMYKYALSTLIISTMGTQAVLGSATNESVTNRCDDYQLDYAAIASEYYPHFDTYLLDAKGEIFQLFNAKGEIIGTALPFDTVGILEIERNKVFLLLNTKNKEIGYMVSQRIMHPENVNLQEISKKPANIQPKPVIPEKPEISMRSAVWNILSKKYIAIPAVTTGLLVAFFSTSFGRECYFSLASYMTPFSLNDE